MLVSRTRRILWRTAAAVSTLVLSGSAMAQAATPSPVHNSTKTTSTSAAASSAFALSAGTVHPDIPTGGNWSFATRYSPGSYCLNTGGLAVQATLDYCNWTTSFWRIYQLTPLDSRGGAQVRIQNASNGQCLDAEKEGSITPSLDGDKVQTYTCNGSVQQTWYLWPLAGGNWMIVNTYDWGMVLDGRTDNTWNPHKEGDPVQMYYHNGSIQQTWQIFN